MSDGPGASVRSDTQRAGRAFRNAIAGEQKTATVYSLCMQDTHEEREKEAFVQSVIRQGYEDGTQIKRTTFDVNSALEQTGAPEELLMRVAEELLGRQEQQAGTRKVKSTKRKCAEDMREVKKQGKQRVADVRPVMKRRVGASAERDKERVRLKNEKEIAAAEEEGRRQYRAKRA